MTEKNKTSPQNVRKSLNNTMKGFFNPAPSTSMDKSRIITRINNSVNNYSIVGPYTYNDTSRSKNTAYSNGTNMRQNSKNTSNVV